MPFEARAQITLGATREHGERRRIECAQWTRKCIGKCTIRNTSFHRERAARRHQHAAALRLARQLRHQARFPDAGIAREQHTRAATRNCGGQMVPQLLHLVAATHQG